MQQPITNFDILAKHFFCKGDYVTAKYIENYKEGIACLLKHDFSSANEYLTSVPLSSALPGLPVWLACINPFYKKHIDLAALEAAAKEGLADAQAALGFCYWQGWLQAPFSFQHLHFSQDKRNKELAFDYLNSASLSGYTLALYLLETYLNAPSSPPFPMPTELKQDLVAKQDLSIVSSTLLPASTLLPDCWTGVAKHLEWPDLRNLRKISSFFHSYLPLKQITRAKLFPKIFHLEGHTLIQCGNDIYARGRNEHGGLGLGDNIIHTNFEKVRMPVVKGNPGIDKIFMCKWFYFVLFENNELYACGDNSMQNLGLDNRGHCNNLTKVDTSWLEEGLKIKKIQAKHRYDVNLVLDNGDVYAIGSYERSILDAPIKVSGGLPELFLTDVDFTGIPEADVSIIRETIFSSGNSLSIGDYENIFVLLENGTIYAKGSNGHGELGLGHTDPIDVFTPIEIPNNLSVIQVATDGESSVFVLSDRSIYECGRNALTRLNTDTLTLCTTPDQLAQNAAAQEDNIFSRLFK